MKVKQINKNRSFPFAVRWPIYKKKYDTYITVEVNIETLTKYLAFVSEQAEDMQKTDTLSEDYICGFLAAQELLTTFLKQY